MKRAARKEEEENVIIRAGLWQLHWFFEENVIVGLIDQFSTVIQ